MGCVRRDIEDYKCQIDCCFNPISFDLTMLATFTAIGAIIQDEYINPRFFSKPLSTRLLAVTPFINMV